MNTENRTGAGAGGGRAEGMSQTSLQHLRPMYPPVSDSRAERDADLPIIMAKAARHMLEHGHDLTPKQKQLLRDIEKGRYQFKVLSQLLDIVPSVNSGGNPLVLGDALNASAMVRLPATSGCLLDVTVDETIAQAALDPWQMRFLDEKTPTVRDAVLDRSGINIVKLQQYHNHVLRWNPTGRRHFT